MLDIVRQLQTDFDLVPDLVDEYVIHTPRSEAIKAARQVCGVSHYLSLMSTGYVDMHKCALYGVTIVCIDEVTDEMGEKLHPEPISDAIRGEPEYEPLEIIPDAIEEARHDMFDLAIAHICDAQDASLAQFDNPTPEEVTYITRQKGGNSALANLYMVKGEVSEVEEDLMMDFGTLMQMLDDYLDQPKDREQGLDTKYTIGLSNRNSLKCRINQVERDAIAEWGRSDALSRFFNICRLHRVLGRVENETPLRAKWLAPGYL